MTKKEKINQLLAQMSKKEKDIFLYKAIHSFVLFKDHPHKDKIVEERLSNISRPIKDN